ncbi:Delta(6)-fatty-acid desaturase fat-3 [Caenorhabditis elegans]|nr:Delta(6)-fatty-acid desaturase fat-3 [Caenorhabditis elegans]CBZ01800.1 Delta(6)-fatty-acid desaturase fat-3 [Caenorhabditis elegans]|eukprot:NP_001255428.1 Delta(6)-fatty-acid desaturase fat-3 [Caenorhabditis elegans]
MTPSPFIDWLWGGLNYQIEHHLFPTMPRCNLNACMKYVKEWCKENNLPYLVDDYFDGYAMNLQQLKNMAEHIQAKAA